MPESRLTEENANLCQNMLAQLPGVFAAGVCFDAGQVREIHILASTERSAKQISRDVQSAIFAMFGQEIDHRIISIAQLAHNPSVPGAAAADAAQDAQDAEAPESEAEAMEPRQVRLFFSGIEAQKRDGMYSTQIHLSYADGCFTGEAQCSDTAVRRNRAVAQATLNAVHAFLGQVYFELLDVKQAEFGGESVVVTVVEQLHRRDPRLLVGAAIRGEDLAESVVRSTLDAVNRKVSLLYYPN